MNLDNSEKMIFQEFSFESFGVKFKILFSSEDKQRIEKILISGLGGCYKSLHVCDDPEIFVKVRNKKGSSDLFINDELIFSGTKEDVFSVLESTIRREISTRAQEVFVHAGVVGWKGQAIMFPGFSYKGKTSLVMELVRLGAEYYSDEFAIINQEGLVVPFPKFLSVRGIIDDRKQVDISVAEIGGVIGNSPIPIGMVLITEYKPNAVWKPKELSKAKGLLEIISHATPFTHNPEKTLRALEKSLEHAKIMKSFRGEASVTAKKILQLIEAGGGEKN